MTLRDACQSALRLIRFQRYPQALEVLERALPKVRGLEDWTTLEALLPKLPQSLAYQRDWGPLRSAIWVGLRKSKELIAYAETFLAQHPLPYSAPLLSDWAWALIEQNDYLKAKSALEEAIPHLHGWRLGMAWRRLASVRFELEDDWQQAMQHAYQNLEGRLKGLAHLEEGHLWQQANQPTQSRHAWIQALPLLKTDAYHLAWVRHALGLSYLRELHPDAERHFSEAERISRKKVAQPFRSRGLQGLGNYRRSRGEWDRAEAAYQEAITVAQETGDRRVALWSLGRCYRLQGKLSLALETLEEAVTHYPEPRCPVQADYAAALLAGGSLEEAQTRLEQTHPLQGNQLYLYQVLKAEISRHLGQSAMALKHLQNLPLESLVMREEASCWPELMAMARQQQQAVPIPLTYLGQTVVQVRALGILKVEVNGRAVSIGPTSRVGELLVLLLEEGQEATVELLTDRLWPDEPEAKLRALWQLVRQLRRAMGWPGSVVARGGAYGLDPAVHWQYDVDRLRTQKGSAPRFLEGVYSPWAQEVAQQLRSLQPPEPYKN